ncbi:M24 family metallopeptidase [Thalassotalea piscium]
MDKRLFLKTTALTLAGSAISPIVFSSENKISSNSMPQVNMDIAPISVAERKQRIAKAQGLMKKEGFAAIVLEPGAAMDYFTGIQWWRSERLTSVIIPREGEIAVVCPFFEEPSIRESLSIGNDVRVWQEHESPFEKIKQILKDRGSDKGLIGFENTVRYFVLAKTMSLLPNAKHASAEPITLGCRMYKSTHELQLLQKSNEVTLRAYEYVYQQLKIGMSQSEVKGLMKQTMAKLGGSSTWCLALFNEASAFPHGTKEEQTIREGSIVLMDSGCSVHGYQSDISRTFVIGSATKKQKHIWNTVRQGQEIAFEKAKVGVKAGVIDDAVRAYYESLNFGPNYQLPGLSHRTGHGIGMEGHESVNFVHGEDTPLNKGMCFSNEPGIYIPGEFGVRLEDCLYMGESKAHWFTEPPTSLDSPLGKLSNPIIG